MVNLVFESSETVWMYDIIHWTVGVGFIVAAILPFKTRHKTAAIWDSIIIAAFGLIFVSYVFFGVSYYLHAWTLPWQLPPEHVIHFIIGLAWLVGGVVTALSVKGRLPHWLRFALPLSLVFSGVRFALPHQHAGSDSSMQYLMNYHYFLGALLVIAGIAIGASYLFKERPAWAPAVILVLVAIPGVTLLAYRHPLDISSNCAQIGSTRTVDVSQSKEAPIEVNLCDKVVFTAGTNGIYLPALGQHEHHAKYPGFVLKSVTPNEQNSFVVSQAGSFELHDHSSDREIGTLIIAFHPEPDFQTSTY